VDTYAAYYSTPMPLANMLIINI